MTAAAALSAIKIRLGIASSVTSFDDAINEFVASAVKRLFPIAQRELTRVSVTPTITDGEGIVDLSTIGATVTGVRGVDLDYGSGKEPHSDFYVKGDKLYLYDLDSSASVFVYPLAPYTLDILPDFLHQAVYWFAMSEFYDLMASDKSSYNVYMQSAGARAVENMRDESDIYEMKANNYLNDRVELIGVSG